jgi:gliding motility-associated transport system permease protein
MGVILATLRKELISYLFSPVAYIIAVVLYFWRGNEVYRLIAMSTDAQYDVDTFVNYYMIYGGCTYAFFLLVPPILTMRCFAEEKRTGSLEVLMTAPVRDFEIVFGKWFAAVVFFALLWLPTLLLLGVLSTEPFLGQSFHLGPVFSAYLGLFLLGAMLLSVGMFTSSLTDNVLLSSMLAMIFNMGLIAAPGIFHDQLGDSHVADVVREQTNVFEHLASWFGRGQIDTSKVVFYVAGILFFLFMTVRSLESRKWR